MPISEWFLGDDTTGAVAWTDTVAERGLSQSYAIKQQVGRTLTEQYNIAYEVSNNVNLTFNIRGIATRALSSSFAIVGGPTQTVFFSYGIKGQISRISTYSYDILPYEGGSTGNNAPTNLSIFVNSSGEAVMSWATDVTKDSYRIYTAPTSTGPFTAVDTIAGGSLNYTYTGLQPGKQVYLTVSAILFGQESAKYVPALSAIKPPAVDPVGSITSWPVTISGQTGPNQLVTVTWGLATRSVTADNSGNYAVTFTAADSIQNGIYEVQVRTSYNTNQNITAYASAIVNVDSGSLPVATSNFFFFFG
jgi:hypothetical protein